MKNNKKIQVRSKYNFQNLFKEFQPKILRYLTRLVGRNEAEDLTQEVFIKVSEQLKNFREESKISTWIYKIATNRVIDRMRQSKSQKFLIDSQKLSDILSEEKDNYNNILKDKKSTALLQQIIKKEMNQCIRDVIDNLSKDYSAVIILKDLEGMKNQEIAEIMNISLSTVKMRLYRARAELKKALGKKCIFYNDEEGNLSCERKSKN